MVCFFLGCALQAYPQVANEPILQFQVIADSASVEGINVINLVSEKTTVTDKNGRFSIAAKPDDLLVLTAVNFEYRRKIIELDDRVGSVILIKMVPKVNQLDEVIVNQYPQITSEALGIVPKDQKKYTPAERRLFTAGDFKPVHLIGLIGGSMALDPVLNAINGKTDQLKQQLEVEKKELLLEKMSLWYDRHYFTDHLKIPEIHIAAFQQYMVYDAEFAKAIDDKNKTAADWILVQSATKYNEIISRGNN